ncbi:hypothetical protein N781_13025 [Pontibacillus halophilus JSM 076056 = DSM 19796]|uniref:DUF1189 domain-containing protein n=1 Tax=Pontibacillus halophilus JSM 076056 = DSM 19796 TaxID=1385510 RepID=A0A0A5G6F5_9BACI|nr:DUF1189 family protein [Pontibacillus halophilus]KGX87609.1 hypothetical protein N781_13025 [Pontibacillus halophilus JSM 076056 = DSM 19796]
MNFWKSFIWSTYQFKRIGAFRLQKVHYVFAYMLYITGIQLIPYILADALGISVRFNQALPYIVSVSLVYLSSIMIYLLVSCAVAAIGLFLGKKQGKSLTYKHTWQIAIYALTLPTLLTAIVEAFVFSSSLLFLFYFTMALIYTLLSVSAIPNRNKNKHP